jgi:hypothetical protein
MVRWIWHRLLTGPKFGEESPGLLTVEAIVKMGENRPDGIVYP